MYLFIGYTLIIANIKKFTHVYITLKSEIEMGFYLSQD